MFSFDFFTVGETDIHDPSVYMMWSFESTQLVLSELSLWVITIVYRYFEPMDVSIFIPRLPPPMSIRIGDEPAWSPGLAIFHLTVPLTFILQVEALIP